MPLAAKIAITVIVVAWTVFLCTIGRWSLSSFYDSVFCRKGNLMGDFVFTEDGEIRPVRIVIVYGVMLALMWLA